MDLEQEEFMQRLMQMFFAELDEHLATLRRELGSLERNPGSTDRETRLCDLHRAAHSIKGAARALCLEDIAAVARELEERLAAVRDADHAPLTREFFALAMAETTTIEKAGHLLRRAHQPSATAPATSAPASPAPGEALLARRRLLVVDDSALARAFGKNALERAGFEVTLAIDGQAALELLEAEGADLVVSDVDMPRLSGFGLAAALRDSERFRDLPIVLVTSRDSAEDRAHGFELGASAYLVKGTFDEQTLARTVSELFKERPS